MTMRLLALIAVTLLVAGCASHVVPATSHQPTTPDQVVIYQDAPSRYEVLGPVNLVITPEFRWDSAGDATPALEQMKRKAAAMGANGLLLKPSDQAGDFAVAAGYRGSYYQMQMKDTPRTALADAIFVINR
jgi:hypothetical protein